MKTFLTALEIALGLVGSVVGIVIFANREPQAKSEDPVTITITGRPKIKTPTGPLTADERVAWVKERRYHKGTNCQIAGFSISHGWRVYAYSPEMRWVDFPRNDMVDTGLPDDSPDSLVMQKAREPNIKAVALLDLYSQPSPRIIRWYYDNGTGVKQFSQAPDSELNSTLQAYLLAVQRDASR